MARIALSAGCIFPFGFVNSGVKSCQSRYIYLGETGRNTVEFTAFKMGTGSRYGVYADASVSTGNRYGVYGRAGGSTGSGRWGVYCDGNFWYTGTLTSTSDARFKSNVRNLESSLALVMAMKPRRYQFQEKNAGLTLVEGPQIGFLAQELEEILPELVETNMHDVGIPGEEGEQVEIKGINYIGLIPVLTRAIQELQTELERVTKELNNLKLQVNGQ